jgi:lysophospholipase L1-like esterase
MLAGLLDHFYRDALLTIPVALGSGQPSFDCRIAIRLKETLVCVRVCRGHAVLESRCPLMAGFPACHFEENMSFAADVRSPQDLLVGDAAPSLYQYRHAFLAEGDSWFSLSQMPSYSLLYGLRFAESALIVNCARPFDTLRNMVDWRGNEEFGSLLGPDGTFRWSGILVSGGGNDLINALDHLLLHCPRGSSMDASGLAQLIDQNNFRLFEAYLRQNFADLIALRDAPGGENNGVPIFAHAYDYATPRSAMASFFGFPAFGPWLDPVMREKNIPEALQIPLARALQDKLAEVLLSLELPNLHIVDTRGLLTPAALGSEGSDGDWCNEIHPSRAGYAKLAQRWDEVIAAVVS